MKRFVIFVALVGLLSSCNQIEEQKGAFDLSGAITEVDSKTNRLLIDDKKTGLTWITLDEHDQIKRYETGQEVVVWVRGGIRESYPAQADALHVEMLK